MLIKAGLCNPETADITGVTTNNNHMRGVTLRAFNNNTKLQIANNESAIIRRIRF